MTTIEPADRGRSRVTRLEWIEAGRAIAALAVVLFHSNTIMTANFRASHPVMLFTVGERGVDFFFVLSGFIIAHVHKRDIGHTERTGNFVLKRIQRIYPLLWLIAGAAILLNLAIDHQNYQFRQLWTSLTLWPSLAWPTPPVTWTLRHEILFYSLFGACIASRRAGGALALAWLAMTLTQTVLLFAGTSLPGIAAMLFSPLNLQFLIGCCAALLHARSGGRHWQPALATGTGALVALVAAGLAFGWPARAVLDYASSQALGLDLAYGPVFGLIVYGLAGASLAGRRPGKLLVLLGAASYAIYLAHTLVMSVAARIAHMLLPLGNVWGELVLTAIALCAGVTLHLLFERPMARGFYALRSRRRAAPTAQESSQAS